MSNLGEQAMEILDKLHTERLAYESEYVPLADAANLLTAYEQTGLDPEAIERMQDAYGRGLTLRTDSAERLQLIREIPTDRLLDLVNQEEWVDALIYDLYQLLLAVDSGIRKRDLSLFKPFSRPGVPENRVPFQRQLSKLEEQYEELLYPSCAAVERKRKRRTKRGAIKRET